MKKKLKIVFLTLCASLTCAMGGHASEASCHEAERGQKLCEFAERLVYLLHDHKADQDLISAVQLLEKGEGKATGEITSKLVQALENKSANPNEVLAVAISDLGRLIKCSADDKERLATGYLIRKEDLTPIIQSMEVRLAPSLPKPGANYHKLMIESLAENQFDLALYAYLKIAEERCS